MTVKRFRTFIFAGLALTVLSSSSCKKDPVPPQPPDNPVEEETISVFTDVRLGNHNNAEYGSFLSLTSGDVYHLNDEPKAVDHQARIDLVYYYDNQDFTKAYIGAPESLEGNNAIGGLHDSNPNGINFWTTVVNGTGIALLNNITIGDFLEIDNFEELKDAWGTTGLMPLYQYDVQPGKIYRFVTEGQKIGLLRIKSITGNGSNSAIMTVEIKIQK